MELLQGARNLFEGIHINNGQIPSNSLQHMVSARKDGKNKNDPRCREEEKRDCQLM